MGRFIFTLGAIAQKFHHRNDATIIRNKQALSDELMAREWSTTAMECVYMPPGGKWLIIVT